MENIHVIICGTAAFDVESVLQGTVEMAHYAWNKKYRFSCSNALSVDRVDQRLLMVCHAIVVCKGCRPTPDVSMYNGRPVISVDGAPEACVEAVRDSEFYYGPSTLAELRDKVLAVALTPTHVVFDALLQCLTATGDLALRRAFWLLDKNNDGTLDAEELLAWAHLTRSSQFEKKDMVELLTSVADVIGPCDLLMTREQFLQLHQHWLASGNCVEAWATLQTAGTHPSGVPYSWLDLHSMRVDRDVSTYLSPHAIQFFRNVYKLKNFRDPSVDIWAVTPGCPWKHVAGFVTESSIALDKFIEYWKYMALERRDTVIQYARHWGYKGDTNYLFVLRHARATRVPSEPLPNTIQVLVVGPTGSGRRSLMFALTAEARETLVARADVDHYVRTTTFFAEKGGAGGSLEEPQTIVYTTVGPDKAALILTSDALNKTFDAVLLCIDGTSYQQSAAFAMETYEQARQSRACVGLPFLLVLTKSDDFDAERMAPAPTVDAEGRSSSAAAGKPLTEELRQFALAHRLLWPPVMSSARRPEESEVAVLNEYMYTVARDPSVALGRAPLTWVRVLRRTTFAAIVTVGITGVLVKVGRWLLSRRED